MPLFKPRALPCPVCWTALIRIEGTRLASCSDCNKVFDAWDLVELWMKKRYPRKRPSPPSTSP